jgi:hypothetical protein
MNFDNNFLKQQITHLQNRKDTAQTALEKVQITESEQFELDNALLQKQQERLSYFSQEDQKNIEKYFTLENQIDLMQKEIQNKIEKNLDNGIYTLKLKEIENLQKEKNEIGEYFKTNPYILEYITSLNQHNPQLN